MIKKVWVNLMEQRDELIDKIMVEFFTAVNPGSSDKHENSQKKR